jgi:leader peptidase (prepilin peptidase)/N-methyltransferase
MFTGLGFCLIFWLDLYLNVHRFPYLQNVSSSIFYGVIPLKAWTISLFHVTFFSFLLTAALTDLDGKIIPLSITIPGTIIGIVFGTFLGWIWPNDPTQFTQQLQKLNDLGWNDLRNQGTIPQGIYPWPFWGPLPNWLPLNSPQLGFVTALVGAAVGTFMTRAVKFVFDKGLGREALGLGDADLMMLAGAFMGWQPTVISFFVGTVVTLVVAIPITILTRRRYSPFGPGLAIGFLITLYCWSWIGPRFQEYLFEPFMILFAISLFAVGAFVASLFLRMLPPPPDSLESEKG